MQIPFIDLRRNAEEADLNFVESVRNAVNNKHFIGGESISNLESELSASNGNTNVVTCANGTDAIQLALRACGVDRGDRVLLPDLTFWATYEAVINAGGIPDVVACDQNGYIDFDAFCDAISTGDYSVAVIAHLYGHVTPKLDEIRDLCLDKNVILIEDCAQAWGVKFDDRKVLSTAAIATLSFYPAKVLGGCGDGGAVFTKCPHLGKVVRKLSNHGRDSHYGYSHVGWNSRMDSIQALYILEQLKTIDDKIDSRRSSLEYYANELTLKNARQILPNDQVFSNGYLSVFLAKDTFCRDSYVAYLNTKGISTGIVYPSPMHAQKAFSKESKVFGDQDVSEDYCNRIFSLPLFPFMEVQELAYIKDALKSK